MCMADISQKMRSLYYFPDFAACFSNFLQQEFFSIKNDI